MELDEIIANEYSILGDKILEYYDEDMPFDKFEQWKREIEEGIKTKEEIYINEICGIEDMCEWVALEDIAANFKSAERVFTLAFDESISDKEYRNMLKKYIIKLGTGIEDYEGKVELDNRM